MIYSVDPHQVIVYHMFTVLIIRSIFYTLGSFFTLHTKY